MQELNHELLAAPDETSGLMKRAFTIMFPGSPAVNSLLATAYISGPPNFLLALCPANIDPSSLSIMVAFAVGGILGDTLLNLLPEIFLGEAHDARAHFVLNDGKRNGILGLFIFIGFITFVAIDKTLRIITSGNGGGHSHSHSHAPVASSTTVEKASGVDTATTSGELKNRNRKKPEDDAPAAPAAPAVKPSSILNLVSDFTHNITDGLAMSGAFYASPLVGATTCMAVMMHEVPHEVGDFALLIQGGFTKWQAMGAQFFTALGAFTGTLIGIAIQEYSQGVEEAGGVEVGRVGKGGLWETDLKAGDLVLPFTAGTFLYVGFSAIPELLEMGVGGKWAEARRSVGQGAAMVGGFALMFWISV